YIIYAEAIVGGSEVSLILGFEKGETSSEAFKKLKSIGQWQKLRETLVDGAIKIREVGDIDLAFERLGKIDVGEEATCP
ncbi:unnamed protein product, partial [marine sediment metagenome]